MVPTPASSGSIFVTLDRADQLDALIAQSHERPVVIFKHSTTCGTSAQAYDEIADYLLGSASVDVHLVDVHAARPLAREIAARFGIRHESPQVLLLVDGQVSWHASHYRVNAQEIERALRRVQRAG